MFSIKYMLSTYLYFPNSFTLSNAYFFKLYIFPNLYFFDG